MATPHDLDIHFAADPRHALLKLRSRIACVGVQLQQKRIHPEQRRHQQHTAIAILDVGHMDEGHHQQALLVDEELSLLASDLLAAIEAGRFNRRPLFRRS